MMAADADKDGFISKAEMPERMMSMLERADTDKDGKLSKEEVTKAAQMAEQMRGRGGPEGGRGEGRGDRGEGRGGERGEGERPRRPASEGESR